MANQNIKLEKSVISQKKSNEIYQKNFSKLVKSNEPVDDDKIIEKYDDLFYDIKIPGKESHKSIVYQSYNHLYDDLNKRHQSSIEKLLQTLASLQKELSDLINPAAKEHPIYEDGSFLIGGINGEKYQDMHTIWVMQEGRKRSLGSMEMYNVIRRLWNLPLTSAGKYFVTLSELNKIPDGKPINVGIDLHIQGEELLAEYDDIFGISAYLDVTFACKGNEVEDIQNIILGDDVEATAQYYLNSAPCIIKYIIDDYTNDETGPIVETLTLAKGESKMVRLLREIYLESDEGFGLNNLPNNMQTYYDNESDPGSEILYNGNTISNYIKLWGPGRRYASVVYAEGRITSKEEWDSQISNEFFQQDTTLQIFNGLPTTGTNYFEVIEKPDDYGSEYFGNYHRIYGPGLGLFGSLNQSQGVTDSYFNDRTFGYYKDGVRKNDGFNITSLFKEMLPSWIRSFVPDIWILRSKFLPIYGQPIIKYSGNYYVVCGLSSAGISIKIPFDKTYRWAFEYVSFYNLKTKDLFTKEKGKADNYGVNLRMSDGFIKGIDWSKFSASQIAFIGLKGEKVVGDGNSGEGQGNDNPWNPKTGGSNYELNSTNTP
tara:strand:- start:4371 stop:6164 length:1794 start_codon:yes stop_codon:yes gene_type:complete